MSRARPGTPSTSAATRAVNAARGAGAPAAPIQSPGSSAASAGPAGSPARPARAGAPRPRPEHGTSDEVPVVRRCRGQPSLHVVRREPGVQRRGQPAAGPVAVPRGDVVEPGADRRGDAGGVRRTARAVEHQRVPHDRAHRVDPGRGDAGQVGRPAGAVRGDEHRRVVERRHVAVGPPPGLRRRAAEEGVVGRPRCAAGLRRRPADVAARSAGPRPDAPGRRRGGSPLAHAPPGVAPGEVRHDVRERRHPRVRLTRPVAGHQRAVRAPGAARR